MNPKARGRSAERLIEIRERILRVLMRNLYPARTMYVDPEEGPVRSGRPLTMSRLSWPDRQPWVQPFIALNLDRTADSIAVAHRRGTEALLP